MKINFKNFGFLEFLVSASAIFVVGMLIWTASTRPAVEAKANLVKENHNKVVDIINDEINKCGNNDEGKFTVWGDPCNGEWIADKVVNYINENLIFGAGIDVFKKEPPDDNNPLLKNEKVYLSPHTAAFTDECMTRMGKETIQNIIDFFEEKLEKSKIVKL